MKKVSLYSILLFVISLFLSCEQKEKEELKPNIIFIFADDLGYGDLGCFGAVDIKTPNIDRLANDGIKFTDFYSASSICSPSRAAFLTGKLPQRLGINGVFFPESHTGLSPLETTIPELLKKQNYVTGMIGKWHLGHRQKFLPLQQGFDSYFGIPYSNDMASVVYYRGNDVEKFNVDQQYITKTYTEEALSFIEANKQKPFFLYLGHNMPHVPIYASPNFKGKSKRGLYGDVIEELDWSVGEILKKLKKENLLENTLVVFSSDNGPWLVMKDHGGSAGELRGGKMYTFEGGMRVPTIAMWKGKIKPNTISKELASQMDWLPTFSKIAGIEVSDQIDGQDISKVLLGIGKRAKSNYLFLDGKRLDAYRKGDWKVKLPFKGFKGTRWKDKVEAHDTLLFNLKKDPGEKSNLFDENKEQARELIKEMRVELEAVGKFPNSLTLRKPSDNSHIKYLYPEK